MLNKVTDNKAFWKTIKAFFIWQKNKYKQNYPRRLWQSNLRWQPTMKIFSNFFKDAGKTLGVICSFDMSNYSHSDLVNNAIRKQENHPSVKRCTKL